MRSKINKDNDKNITWPQILAWKDAIGCCFQDYLIQMDLKMAF